MYSYSLATLFKVMEEMGICVEMSEVVLKVSKRLRELLNTKIF